MTDLTIEYHYKDGSVGAHPVDAPEGQEALGEYLWSGFAQTDHEVSHIVIRPDTSAGQALSNRLCAVPELLHALQAMLVAIDTHDSQGGNLVKTLNRANLTVVDFSRAAIAKAKGGAS